jgi:hypothetical protein
LNISSPLLLGIRIAVLHGADNNGQMTNNAKRSSTSRHKKIVNNERYTDRHLATNFGDHGGSLTSEEWRAAVMYCFSCHILFSVLSNFDLCGCDVSLAEVTETL